MGDDENGIRFRTQLRVPISMDVELQFDDSGWSSYALNDISWGGIFVRTQNLKPLGAKVAIQIPVTEDGVKLEVRGKVVRHNKIVFGEPVVGMGIEFNKIDDEAKSLIQGLINKKLLKK